MNLNEIITINAHVNDAAIVLDKGLSNSSLVGSFMPTKATIKVFEHLNKAVSPSATQEQRAINIYGSYGSGKSHLAVVIAHLLKFGASSEGFDTLLSKISNSKNDKLANNLKSTFLSDSDARPYLFVSLYGSNTTSIGAKLLQGLYDALEREPLLEPTDILPRTEFDSCRERLQVVINSKPDILNQDLDEIGITEYLDIEQLLIGLENHENQAVKVFLEWHKKEFVGLDFNIASDGGKNFIDAYKEAGNNLYKNYNYAGIVVLWDEFGHAIEDLISSPYRNSGEEIIQLQQFVETTCSPSFGHTIFIGVTHVSFGEYGDRTKADNVVKDGLAKISGRFNSPFRIELSASENEGYHLLDMQKSWTLKGKTIAQNSHKNKEALIKSCLKLSMFETLRDEIEHIVSEVYPLHPSLAVGLFNLAQIAAQANRTALTFFRDNSSEILSLVLDGETIWHQELIRLPKIINFYDDKFKTLDPKIFKIYEKSLAKIIGKSFQEIERRKDILRLILLSNFLGDNFQVTESFLSTVLYDSEPESHKSTVLFLDLDWLKSASLIWKNVATEHWQLSGETGVSVDDIVLEEMISFETMSLTELLKSDSRSRNEFFPMLGFGNFEPKSNSGIIRSYSVKMHTDIYSKYNDDLAISCRLNMIPVSNSFEAEKLIESISQSDPTKEVYYWVSSNGVDDVKMSVEGAEKNVLDLLKEYLAINRILDNKTLTDSVKSQLIAKKQLVNRCVKQLVSRLFGKDGLTSNGSVVIKSGSNSPIAKLCNWNDIKLYLESQCHSIYNKDIPVRYMKMNFLFKHKEIGNDHPNAPLVAKVAQKILDYSTHTTYHTMYLGEKSETSPESGVINGILGKHANDVFIERPDLDIKGVDETDGNLNEILTLIKKRIVKRREKPFEIISLERELGTAPYGIPSCVIPILIAIAIRNEQSKITFLHRENNTGTALARCFMNEKPLKSRVVEFTTKQVSVLSLYGQVLREIGAGGELRSNFITEQSLAESYIKSMKGWFKNLSEATLNSKLLSVNAKAIAKTFTAVGVTNQDIADATVTLLELNGTFSHSNLDSYIESLALVFKEFSQIEDQKKQLLLDAWSNNVPQNFEDLIKVQKYLGQFNDDVNKRMVDLIERIKNKNVLTVTELVNLKYSKTLVNCTDSEINNLCNLIEFSINQGLNYKNPNNENENAELLFVKKVNQIIANFKSQQAKRLLDISQNLKLKENSTCNEIATTLDSDLNIKLEIVVKDILNKEYSDITDADREQIRDKIIKHLETALYSVIKNEKLTTDIGLKSELHRIIDLSTMTQAEKVALLNEILLELSNYE